MFTRNDLVVGRAASAASQLESITDFDTFDRLDPHQRPSQLRVQPAVPVNMGTQSRGQTPDNHFDDAAECVAILLCLFHLSHHRRACSRVEAANRIFIDGGQVGRARDHSGRRPRRTELNNMAQQADAERLLQERGCYPAQRHPGRRFPGAGTLQYRAGLLKVVLLHAHQVGVTWTRSGQCSVAGLSLEF